MARNRGQQKTESGGRAAAKATNTPEELLSQGKNLNSQKRQRKQKEEIELDGDNSQDEITPASKKTKTIGSTPGSPEEANSDVDRKKLDALQGHGVLPLQDSDHVTVDEASPETMLALVYLAILTSARISHVLAYKSVKCLLEADYHDLRILRKSTWEERTKVLTKGGYTWYREKTARALGELTAFVEEKHDGDLNALLKRADSSPANVRSILQNIKRLGKVGTGIFFDTAQGVWPTPAPFIDPRSMDTAKRCGLGSSLDRMWEAVGKDPPKMCKLSSALTMVRLDKKEDEFN